ncbi:lipase-like domain-containing protein [Staphylococcus xylosus]|uniref:esterase/lipase family protein n=1 Tax=Staphylococcus xylosus TaxID=1288 RepID=UPI003F5589EC
MKLKNKIILPLTSLTTTSILFVALSTVSQASADEREVNQSTNEQGLDSFQKVNIKTQNQNNKPENLSNPSNSEQQSPDSNSKNVNLSSNSNTQNPSNDSKNEDNPSNSEQQSPDSDSKNVKQSSNLNIQDSKDEDNAANLEQRDTNNDAKVANQLTNSDVPEDNAKSENNNQPSDFVEQDSNVESQKQNNVSEDEQQDSKDTPQRQNSAAEDEQSDSNDASQKQNNAAEDEQSDSNDASQKQNSAAEDEQSDSNDASQKQNNTAEDKQSISNDASQKQNNTAEDKQSESNDASQKQNSAAEDKQSDSNDTSQKQNSAAEDEQSDSNDASQKQDSAAEDEQSESNDTSQKQNSAAEDKQSISNNTSENKNEVAKEDNYTPTIPKGNQGVVKKNKYPIILAHGFSGYPDESKPAVLPPYWGGNKVDLDKELNKQGYDVREGGMSPFGSNYDRALELYYYIKGGTVDYGAYHSKKYGHARYGKTYKGIYPEWAPGKKVHLVGHSFGGQTIQVLEDMLRNGVPEEIEYQKKHGGDIPEIFAGGNNNMVSSVTTIATPHNGTFISDKLGNKPIARKLFYNILKYTSNKYTKADYGLEPWGIKQRDDESFIQYLKRVKDNKVWKTEDTSFTDGSIEGSKKINDRLTLSKDVAYTSITAEDTHKTFNNRQRGNFKMFAPFKILANLVGRQNPESWREGDGPVPLKSGLYPFNKPHKDTTFDSKPELGLWGVMPTLKNWDHMDLVGWDLTDTRIKPKMVLGLYEQLANYLSEVEKVQESAK